MVFKRILPEKRVFSGRECRARHPDGRYGLPEGIDTSTGARTTIASRFTFH
jgi:hypothetical protein